MESVKTPPFTVGEHLGAHHDIDLTNLTAGNYVTLNGHWYGLEKADCRTSAYFHPKSPATGPTNIELTLVHCPWLGCPAAEPETPALSPLRWHMGPTETDPDPGSMWCYDCGSQVLSIDGAYGCTGCGREEGDGE